MTATIPGDGTYEIVRQLTPERAIIRYQSLLVLAVRTGPTTWQLSPTPASTEENLAITELARADGTLERTIVDVEPPDASS